MRTKEREVWLAVRLRVDCAEGEDEAAKGAGWLSGVLQGAGADAAARDGIAVTSEPLNLVDAAVRVLQQAARERERGAAAAAGNDGQHGPC